MTKTRILLVDDEPDFSKLTALELKNLGYDVVTVVDGQEALDLIRDNKPDLVLMDIVLNGQIDGVEAAEEIRSRFNIPVVYLTGYTDDKTLARAKITEPFGYVVKPFECRELRIAIEIALYKADTESKLKTLTEKLRASTASFHNIVEKNADGIVVVDRNRIVRFVNHAAEVIFGHKVEELLGETFSFPIVTSEMMEVNIIRKGGENGVGDMRIVDIQWESKPAYLVSIRDITEHKKMEEALRKSERKYRSLVESIPDVTWTTDCEGNTTFISPNVEKVYGYNPEEIYKAGYSLWFGRIHPDDVEKVKEAYRELFEKLTRFDIEYRIKRKDGQWIWLHNRSTVIYEKDGVLYADGVFSDVTERKKVGEALENLNAELKTTIKKLALANRELQDFVRAASHDLKTPLGGIKKLAEWISTDYADKLNDGGRDLINSLLGRVDRMYNLIGGILQYSKIGSVKELQSRVDINKLVQEVIDMVAPPENVTITVENQLPLVKCEKTHITEVFQNLLSNAVKFMDKPQGKVRIGCVEENGFWRFSIADNGLGIEERYFERVFELFKTVQPRDKFEGTGIGLAMAKKIVQLYGGQIWVESQLGKGSTFFFTLPKQKVGVISAKLEANIAY